MSIKKLPKNLFLVGDNMPPNLYNGFDIWKQFCASTDESIPEGTLLLDFPRKPNRMYNAINPYETYMSPSQVNYSMFEREYQNFKFYSLTAEAINEFHQITNTPTLSGEDYAEFSMLLDRKLPSYGTKFTTINLGFATMGDEDLKGRFTQEELYKIVELKNRVKNAMSFTGNINTKLIVRYGDTLKFMSLIELFNFIAEVHSFENLDKIGVTTFRYNIRAGKTERDILGTLDNLTPDVYCIQIRTGVYYKGNLRIVNGFDLPNYNLREFYNIHRGRSEGQPLEVKYLIKSSEFTPVSDLFDDFFLTELKNLYNEIVQLFDNTRFTKRFTDSKPEEDLLQVEVSLTKTMNKEQLNAKSFVKPLQDLILIVRNTSHLHVEDTDTLLKIVSSLKHKEPIIKLGDDVEVDISGLFDKLDGDFEVALFSVSRLIGTRRVQIAGLEKVLEHVYGIFSKTGAGRDKFGQFIMDSLIYTSNSRTPFDKVQYLENFNQGVLEESSKFLEYAFNNVPFFKDDKGRQSLFLHLLIEEFHDYSQSPAPHHEGSFISSNPLG